MNQNKEDFRLPSPDVLISDFMALAQRVTPILQFVSALETGRFVHPDGRVDDLGEVRLGLAQAALLSHLCRQCPSQLSVEIGFGMGSSTGVILGTRAFLGHIFEHLVYDPYGLGGNRGKVVESYLDEEFKNRYRRIWKPSEVGLAQLLDERGKGSVGLIFVDGGHCFENVMTDFVLADRLCCRGGYIIFDDAWFPAIETVINYVMANRPDYSIAHLPVDNTSVIKKIGSDRRDWCSFKPFKVPDRCDWNR